MQENYSLKLAEFLKIGQNCFQFREIEVVQNAWPKLVLLRNGAELSEFVV